jgi:uncharacterized membrane protein
MTWNRVGKWLFAAIFVASGIGHFVATDTYMKIMPPYVPWHRTLVLVSGVFDVVLGVCLLVPKTERVAAWGLVVLLIAVFPANIYLFQHPEITPWWIPPIAHLLRLPLQAVLIFWAWTSARR